MVHGSPDLFWSDLFTLTRTLVSVTLLELALRPNGSHMCACASMHVLYITTYVCSNRVNIRLGAKHNLRQWRDLVHILPQNQSQTMTHLSSLTAMKTMVSFLQYNNRLLWLLGSRKAWRDVLCLVSFTIFSLSKYWVIRFSSVPLSTLPLSRVNLWPNMFWWKRCLRVKLNFLVTSCFSKSTAIKNVTHTHVSNNNKKNIQCMTSSCGRGNEMINRKM